MLCQQVDGTNDLVLVDAVLAYVSYASKDSTAFKVAVAAAAAFSAEEIAASKKVLYEALVIPFKDSRNTPGRSASEANVTEIYEKLSKLDNGSIKVQGEEDRALHISCPVKFLSKMPKCPAEASTMDALAEKLLQIEKTITDLHGKVESVVEKPGVSFANVGVDTGDK